MQKIINSGRLLFAIALAGFGIIQFVTGSMPGEFMPLRDTMEGKAILAYLTGTIFIAVAICIPLNLVPKISATLAGVVFSLLLLYPRLPALVSNIYDPAEWVASMETLSFACGGFILAATMPGDSVIMLKWSNAIRMIAVTSRYMFAIAILVFGIQHIMYEKFILTLIPGWIPGKLFWSHIVKIAFLGAGLSIILNVRARLASFLLGIMFLGWVLIVHIPGVSSRPNLESEWTSLFVALAMSGISFTIAKTSRQVAGFSHNT